MNAKYPESLQALIAYLKKLPGVGLRTAERFAFDLLKWKQGDLSNLGQLLSDLQKKILTCSICGCLTDETECQFCTNPLRDPASLCILSTPRDAYAIEETRSFRGLYHVIDHLLSPLDGRHAASIRIDRIEERIKKHQIKEVIIAFDSTLEGDATSLYIKQQLAHLPISISRLAFGLPVGSNLEYIDRGTLSKALLGRQTV